MAGPENVCVSTLCRLSSIDIYMNLHICIEQYTCVYNMYMYEYMHTCSCNKLIKKSVHEFEGDQEEVCGSVWREEEEGDDTIILFKFSQKRDVISSPFASLESRDSTPFFLCRSYLCFDER